MINKQPIVVRAIQLDPDRLPMWCRMIWELPLGCGIKGGNARKIAKVIFGRAIGDTDLMQDKDVDLDILVAVDEVTSELRLALRHYFSGYNLAGLIVSPKDIEVSDCLERYFRTRDVTMNEVIVFKSAHGVAHLLYTEQAKFDIQTGTIRPSVHCLHNSYNQNWRDRPGLIPVLTPKPLARCIIRMLKGHGIEYAINEATWSYYHYAMPTALTQRELFRILRFFADDDDSYARCVTHLVDLGLLAPHVDANLLWGECLQATNTSLTPYGRRLTFSEPSADAIEAWVQQKHQEYINWLRDREQRIIAGELVEPDDLALVTLPPGWEEFPVLFKEPGAVEAISWLATH